MAVNVSIILQSEKSCCHQLSAGVDDKNNIESSHDKFPENINTQRVYKTNKSVTKEKLTEKLHQQLCGKLSEKWWREKCLKLPQLNVNKKA